MKKINFEFKARCTELEHIFQYLSESNASCIGLDHQIDTYFNVKNGRLKLREGNIEKHLIWYNRPDISTAKNSEVLVSNVEDPHILKEILKTCLEILVVVDKERWRLQKLVQI